MQETAAWFIDGAYLFKVWQSLKRSDRLDYLKLRSYLEETFEARIGDAYYFNADADPATAKATAMAVPRAIRVKGVVERMMCGLSNRR